MLLYKAFGWEPTEFAHLPLILNKDKSKLSKRQGDVYAEDFLAKGYLIPALLNFIVLLGWNPKTEQELFTLDDLIREFDLTKVNKSPAIFDYDKLDWINGLYIRAMDNKELLDLVQPYWQKMDWFRGDLPQDYLLGVVRLEKERLHKLSEITEHTSYFFVQPEYDGQLLVWKKSTAEKTREVLEKLAAWLQELPEADFSLPQFEEKLKKFIVDNNYDNGSVLWPLRVALTGLEKPWTV